MATTKKTTKPAAKAPKAAAPKAPRATKKAKPAEPALDLFAEEPAKPAAKAPKAATAKAPKAPAKPKAAKAPAKAAEPTTTNVTFRIRAEVGSKVFLAGSFNGWDPTDKPMKDAEGNGVFTCTVALPKGRHEYKFVINGAWCADPECTDWVSNDMGTLNSVKVVD